MISIRLKIRTALLHNMPNSIVQPAFYRDIQSISFITIRQFVAFI